MRRQALGLLLSSLALAGCVQAEQPVVGAYRGPAFGAAGPVTLGAPSAPPVPGSFPSAPPGAAPGMVALLLPLSGPNADRAQAMLKAAQLAFDVPGAPGLDVRDTSGTPAGAASAAQQAIAAHDLVIVGPLTNVETAAVAQTARGAAVPVLAFTSDPAQAQPGVWVLGLTPVQQVRRLVAEAQAQGKSRFAALLPENDFGRVMADALNDAAAAAGAQPPTIRRYGPGMAAMNTAVRELADYTSRRGTMDADIQAARARGDAAGRQEAADIAARPIPPVAFDTLLLADVGSQLTQLATLLPFYNVDIPPVKVMGPALWASSAVRAGAGSVLNGAWYAAPDPAARAGFERLYAAKYGTPPGPLTDLVYDAASLARVVVQQGGNLSASLTRSEGFSGADGLIGLLPDGHVRRGLAVFELRGGTPGIVDQAPQTFVPGT